MSGNSDEAPVRIRAGSSEDLKTALEVLNRSYSTDRFTIEWHRWKHLDSPFGRSRLWLAEGPLGVDGLFFALPWNYRDENGEVAGVRTVDGATLPSARGRGVLGKLIATEYNEWTWTERPGVLVATATDAARRSHVKNGALALPQLDYAYHVPKRLGTAQLEHGDQILDSYRPDPVTGMSTAWTPAALRWRSDPRSGHVYECVRLVNTEAPNGLLFRVESRGRLLRILVAIAIWGDSADRRQLLASAARTVGAPLILAPSGAGAEPTEARRVMRAGHTWVCVWDRRLPPEQQTESRLCRLEGWQLTYGELEGLI